MRNPSLLCLSLFGAAAGAASHSRLEEATEFTLTYGYPLMPFVTFAVPTIEAAKGTNRFEHYRELATAEFHDVVRANVDTLYSMSILDLTHHDLIVDVPVVKDRYWVFPFYDAYANNYVNIGSVHNSTAGRYAVRFDPSGKKQPGLQLCTQTRKEKKPRGECHGVDGYINSPTAYGILLPRYAVKGTPGDLQEIHALQNKSRIHIIEDSQKPKHPGAPLTISMLNSSISSNPATRIMQLTARIAPNNPPRNISDSARVNRMLEEAGMDLHKATYKAPQNQNLTRAYLASEENMVNAAIQPQNLQNLGHDWVSLANRGQGDYGTNYLMRQFVAYRGYLGLTQSEALYPSYSSSNGGQTLNMGPKEAYIFKFPSKPPLAQYGFWSLTAYDAEQFLVSNPLNRYALSDRSNITYVDGSLVYGGEGHANDSFELLVQPADLEPPKNWTSNWLPAPKGGGEFSLTLRFYAPSDALRQGEWAYPGGTKAKRHCGMRMAVQA